MLSTASSTAVFRPRLAGAGGSLAPQRRWRVALYSHDTMGLGHKRRNLLIAQTLGASAIATDVLLISGMRDASDLPTPVGVDCLTLPALCKRPDGQYQSRRLEISLQDIIGLRSQVIRSAVKAFQPDVLIVDNVPRGAVRELDPTLEYIKTHLPTRCVLGLRDVLDAPAAVQRDWQRAAHTEAIRRYYDAVWIYGDPQVYDPRREYGFAPDLVAKMRPLGYLDQRARLAHVSPQGRQALKQLNLPEGKLVLCQVGGGQDGADLALAFAQAQFPPDTFGVILTGPFMPLAMQRQLARYATQNPQLRVLEYVEEPTLLLQRADRVVAMAGYNTTCEILSFQKPALLVPRVRPRLEQWIRAERLQQLGLVEALHPKRLSPHAITNWLQRPISAAQSKTQIDLNGLNALLLELGQVLEVPA
jgi:predicted glycosyltransferase